MNPTNVFPNGEERRYSDLCTTLWQPGQKFYGDYGHYEVVKEMGKGSMGLAYEVRELQSGRRFIVKFPHNSQNRGDFEKQVNNWLRCPLQPCLLMPDTLENFYGVPHLFIEKSSGGSLGEYLREGKSEVPLPAILAIGIQICEALEYLHHQGFTHNNIKPNNILIGDIVATLGQEQPVSPVQTALAKQSTPLAPTTRLWPDGPIDFHRQAIKITDLGLATKKTIEATDATPEPTAGVPLDEAADLYAVGVILYQMIAGRFPFAGQDGHSLSYQDFRPQDNDSLPPSPQQFNPACPEDLAKAILTVFQKKTAASPLANLKKTLPAFKQTLQAAYENLQGHAYPCIPSTPDASWLVGEMSKQALMLMQMGAHDDMIQMRWQEAWTSLPLSSETSFNWHHWLLSKGKISLKKFFTDTADIFSHNPYLAVIWRSQVALEHRSDIPECLEEVKRLLQEAANKGKVIEAGVHIALLKIEAEMLYQVGRYPEAVVALEHLLQGETDQDNPQLWWLLGASCLETDKPEKARQAWTQGEQFDPAHQFYHCFQLGRALLHSREERWEEARQCLEQIKENDDWAILHLAEFYSGAGMYRRQGNQDVALASKYYEEIGWRFNCSRIPSRKQPPENQEILWMSVAKLRGHRGPVEIVKLTPDGRLMLSASEDNTLRLWELPSGKCLAVLPGHHGQVKGLAIAVDGRFAISGSQDKTLRLWELPAGKCMATLQGHGNWVTCVQITPDGRFALSGSADSTLRLWELPTGKCLATLQGHERWITCLAITPDGRFALSGSRDNTLRLWELPSGQCRAVLQGHTDWVTCLHIMANGLTVLSGGMDGSVRLWELASGQCVREFKGHKGAVRGIAVTPDERFALTGGYDSVLRLWEISSGLCHTKFTGQHGQIRSLVMTPDGRFALSGSYDKTMHLWELTNSKFRVGLQDHENAVSCVTMSPNGRFVVSASRDSTICVWEDASWRNIFWRSKSLFCLGPFRSVPAEAVAQQKATAATAKIKPPLAIARKVALVSLLVLMVSGLIVWWIAPHILWQLGQNHEPVSSNISQRPLIKRPTPDNKVPDNKVPDNKVPDNKVPDNKVPDSVRIKAIQELAMSKTEQSVALLGESLQDSSADVRLATVAALANLGSDYHKQVAEHLLKVLADESSEMREKVSEALAVLPADLIIPLLSDIARQDPDLPKRRHALVTLGRTKNREVTVLLVASLQDISPQVRRGAARGLGLLQNLMTVPELVTRLRDPDTSVQMEAAKALRLFQTMISPKSQKFLEIEKSLQEYDAFKDEE